MRATAIFLWVVLVALPVGFGILHFSFCEPRDAKYEAMYARETQASANNKQCRADPLCAALTEAPAEISTSESRAQEREEREYTTYCAIRFKTTDGLLSVFTFLLVLVGIGQAVYLRETIIDDERSRLILERAYVSGGGTIKSLGTTFEIHINNHGRTAARLRRIYYGFIDVTKVSQTPLPPYAHCLTWLDSIGQNHHSHRVATVQIPPPFNQAICVRFVYDDIFFGECTAGFIQRIIPGNNDPEPVSAPEAYTARTERGTWIAPNLPPEN